MEPKGLPLPDRSVNVTVDVISPEMATRILSSTKFRNRPLSHRHVEYLSDLIKQGLWKFNGDTIKLDKDGNILDGQHRLAAIAKSGHHVRTCIVRELDSSVFDAIDTNRRARTDSNVLSIAGLKHTATLAAALKMVASYDQMGHRAFGASTSVREKYASKATTIMELIGQYPDVHDSVNKICSLCNSTIFRPSSVVSAMHYIFGRHNSGMRDVFFDRLHQNSFYHDNCPARQLFMAYQSEKLRLKMGSSQRYRAALWFKAFDYFCTNKRVQKLMVADENNFPKWS